MPMLMTLRIRLPVCPFHSPLRTRLEKAAIWSSTAWTSGTTFFAVDHDRLALWRAQRDVQHGAIFGCVDLLAAEHRVDPRAQARLFGELQQQLERLVGDAILRVIEVEARRLRRQAFAALGIVGEQLAQVQALDLAGGARRAPSRRVAAVRGVGWCRHIYTLSKA